MNGNVKVEQGSSDDQPSIVTPRATFRPFKFESDAATRHGATVAAAAAVFHAAEVRDLTGGIKTILQMLEIEYLDDEARTVEGDPEFLPPMLNQFHRAKLLRMAIACSGVLERNADEFCQEVDREASAREKEVGAWRANGRNPQA